MKNLTLSSSLVIILFITLCSFSKPSELDLSGTYGVAANDPSQIQLILNKDQTFSFQDFSNPEKQVSVSGNWEIKKGKVLLKTSDSANSFHQKWSICKDGMVAKSRKGLTFYRLIKK